MSQTKTPAALAVTSQASPTAVQQALLGIALALLDGLERSQSSWEDEEESVQREHASLIASNAALIAKARTVLPQLEASAGADPKQLRREAASLLHQAEAVDGKRLYVAVHTHRFGETVYPVWSVDTPSEEEVIGVLQSEFEPEIGESISVHDVLDSGDLAGADSAEHIGDVAPAEGANDPGEPEESSENEGPRP